MIVINVLGTDDDVQERTLRALTSDLLDLCRVCRGQEGYVVFPADRMQMGLGEEIVVQVFCDNAGEYRSRDLGREIGLRLRRWCPKGTKVGVQLIEAQTIVELTS